MRLQIKPQAPRAPDAAAGRARKSAASTSVCRRPRRHAAAIMVAALTAALMAAAPALAQSPLRDGFFSAAYWRDVCSGDRAGISRPEQERMCRIYLSSFHDAADEYADAGHKLFCAPETMTAEAMRRAYLSYMAELAETAEFFPAGRALVQALVRAYPCETRR
jgi:Rap1a immunity proteins